MNNPCWQEFEQDLFFRLLASDSLDYLPPSVSSFDKIKHLRCSLDQMLPPGVVAFADQITDQEAAFEYPEEEEHMVNAVSKRRNEFITGRRCARKALREIGLAPCALVPGEGRAPLWPAEVIGSISHSGQFCCAAVAHTDAIACLGIDLEKTSRISSAVMGRVIHPLEKVYVNNDQMRGSLIFSVKEAFFKAQFPIWKTWPNFDDLAFKESDAMGRLNVLKAADHLPGSLLSALKKMHFRYAFFDDYVLTLCWLNKLPVDGSN